MKSSDRSLKTNEIGKREMKNNGGYQEKKKQNKIKENVQQVQGKNE